MFEDKVLAQLRTKYAGKGLTDATLLSMAKKIAAGITEENQIAAGVDGVEDYVNMMQANADAIRAAAKKDGNGAGGQGNGGNGQGGTQGQPAGDDGADANNGKTGEGKNGEPEWKTAISEMQDMLTKFIGGSVSSTRLTKVNEKLAGVPEAEKAKIIKAYNRMNFETPEDFEDYLTNELTPQAQEMAQKKTNDDLGQGHRPFVGATSTSTPQQAVDEIKAWRAGAGAQAAK